MTLGEFASQIDQALFGEYGSLKARGETFPIILQGHCKQVTIKPYTFITQDPHEASLIGRLALESCRIIWIIVDGRVRGDGYVNANYVRNVANYCLDLVSARA